MSSGMSGIVNRRMDEDDAERQLGNGHSLGSALQLFGNAKRKINDIFTNIGQYVLETDRFVDDVNNSPVCSSILSKDNADKVHSFCEKIDGITEVLARDHMKVVFFGRTSNGKSTTINAMLREKILPSGIGHTTHCFIQVEGSDSKDGFLLTEDTDKPKSIKDIKQLGSALSEAKLKENSLIRILWPKDKCRLLREDVVLVDSPGIDVSTELDVWIDKFCLDADVFVLVANAESTLMQTEKNFFHKVSAKLSKPNIFILQNRWDVSEMEEDIDQVKQQHIDRNSDFLSEELKVTDKKSAKDRLFFVSAREALASRLSNDKVFATPERVLLPGFQARLFEFSNFEKEFEKCISQSAVKTKFEQHTKRAYNINAELRAAMEEAYTNSLSLQEEQLTLRKEKSERLAHLERQLDLIGREVKAKILSMVDDVERKVSVALNDEIRRLYTLVEEFERPFHPDPMLLQVYKKELHSHVGQTLGRNLQARCSSMLVQAVEDIQTQMTDKLAAILPEDSKAQLISMMPKRDFEIAYRLDCRNLCAGFREDIEFRFSLSPTMLLQRLIGSKGNINFLDNYFVDLEKKNGAHSEPAFLRPGGSGEAGGPAGTTDALRLGGDSEILVAVLQTFASLTSRSTLGAVAVAGMVAKAAGWRVIVVSAGLYGGVYLYERLTWTTKARERAFKTQYVDYASSKLRLIIDLTSSNCSHQVQQELSSTFARLCHQADVTKAQLEGEVRGVDAGLQVIRDVAQRAKTLRNKADFFDRELQGFVVSFLSHAGF